ncbi:MAG TPA: archaeosortase/exosortase family protein [Chthoniobacteraceae bacterium]|nr:archaeosortase/exosortase family protein [Chthoniobacteraceae bacterium]
MSNSRRARKKARNAPPPTARAAVRRWFDGKLPLLLFVAKFFGLVALFYGLQLLPPCKHAIEAVTVGEARLAGLLLNVLGQRNHVDGNVLWEGNRSVIAVVESCSGFDFLSLFTAAVLVFPAAWRRKIAGILVGLPLLMALNLLRIMTLYILGAHFSAGVFDIAHEDIWAILLIACTIILYILWIRWAGADHLDHGDGVNVPT